jgi:peptidoglycan/LPS O-acetylase OafA/YrhL
MTAQPTVRPPEHGGPLSEGAAEAPSPAVAPPPGNPRFPLFDSLRAIAALSVLSFHVAAIAGALERGFAGNMLAMLSRGVILFFVISGFLLYRPFVAARAHGRPRPDVARYARRRVLRIVPAYWVALTVLAVFPGIPGVFSDDWWRYYFFLQLYSESTFTGGIAVAWTLCVEVSFYLLLPLYALAVGRIGARSGPRAWLRAELVALAGLAALGVVIQLAEARQEVSMSVGQSLLGQLTWFALGMGLAVASVAVERGGRRPQVVAIIAERSGLLWLGALASFVGLALLLHPGGLLGIAQALETEQSVPRTLAAIALTASLSGLLVLPAVFGTDAGGIPRRLLAAAPLAWLGLISYGIYLWHLPLAQLIGMPPEASLFSSDAGLDLVGRVPQGTTPVLLAATVAATVAVAAVSYYVVELPFLRRKER